MNEKLNPIFTALSNIDDNIISESVTPRKTSVRLAVIIAAAALVLATGASANWFIKDKILVDEKPAFELNLEITDVNILTAAELENWGAKLGDNGIWNKTALPSEVFGKFGISPLMSDKFKELPSEIMIDIDESSLQLKNCSFQNLTTGQTISYSVMVKTGEKFGLTTGTNSEYTPEIVTLKNGEKALLYKYYSRLSGGDRVFAEFTDGGLYYELKADNSSFDEMKQILEDLGVL